MGKVTIPAEKPGQFEWAEPENRSRVQSLLTKLGAFVIPCTFPWLAPSAYAADAQWGVQAIYGVAQHRDSAVRQNNLAVVWNSGWRWWETESSYLTMAVEGNLGYWHLGSALTTWSLTEVGIMPILRLIRASGEVRPYLEAGVGVRLLSHARLDDGYTLSTAFQFADSIGVGAQFGKTRQYQLGLRFQHLSNAGIKKPNPGINFWQLYGTYYF